MYIVEYFTKGEQTHDSEGYANGGWLKQLDLNSLQQFCLEIIQSGGIVVAIRKV